MDLGIKRARAHTIITRISVLSGHNSYLVKLLRSHNAIGSTRDSFQISIVIIGSFLWQLRPTPHKTLVLSCASPTTKKNKSKTIKWCGRLLLPVVRSLIPPPTHLGCKIGSKKEGKKRWGSKEMMWSPPARPLPRPTEKGNCAMPAIHAPCDTKGARSLAVRRPPPITLPSKCIS